MKFLKTSIKNYNTPVSINILLFSYKENTILIFNISKEHLNRFSVPY